MSSQVSEYLEALKGAMAGSDAAIIQDALSDAEDHLRSALAGQLESNPDAIENEALQVVVEEYGQPEEVAAAYKEIENRIRPALSPSLSQPKRNIVSAFFGVITEPRAWGALLYMLLSLVTGIVYFTWVVTGLSLSAGLLVLIIGLPFIGLFLLSVRGIALVEGRIVEALLGEPMPRRPLFIDKDLNLWKRFKVLVADGRTWLAMVYMALQLPLGIIYFTLFVTLLSVSLSFIATPVLRLIFGPLSIENQHGLITSVILPSPDYWIPILVVAGVALFFGSIHLAKWMGWLHARFAKFMLVRS
jgi:hypothetical protein